MADSALNPDTFMQGRSQPPVLNPPALNPDVFMQGRSSQPQDLTPDSFMAHRIPPPELPKGLPRPGVWSPGDELIEDAEDSVAPYWETPQQRRLAEQYNRELDAWKAQRQGVATPVMQPAADGPMLMPGRPDTFWERAGRVFTEGPLGALFRPRVSPEAERLAPFDRTAVPVEAQPILKLSELDRQREPVTITEGARRGLLEGLEGFTSPQGMSMMVGLGALGRLRGVGQAAAAAVGAGFDADMILHAVQEVPEAKELWDAGQQGEAARVAVRSLLSSGLGTAGAVHKGRTLSRQTPIPERPLTPVETTAIQERAVSMGGKQLKREAQRMQPGAAAVFEQESAARKARSVPPAAPQPEEPPAPAMNRAQRRAAVAVPEEGQPEADIRLEDAHETLAQALTGKPVKDLTPDEFTTVADLARQGYGSAAQETPTAAAETPAIAAEGTEPTRRILAPVQAQPASPEAAEQISSNRTLTQPRTPREPKTTPVYGSDTDIRIPGESKRYRAVYSLRDAEDLQASHNAFSFEKNPEYEFVNDRNYAEPQNAERIIKQVAEFDPEYLVNSNPTAENGPPIIDSRGNVLGGNSRTMTLSRVEQANPQAIQQYRNLIAQQAKKFGISPELARRMRRPVLVREVAEDIPDPQAAITDFNKVGTAELRQAERAIADSRRVTQGTLDEVSKRIEDQGPEGTLTQALAGDARDIVNRLVDDGVMTTAEKPRLLNADGTLTVEGKARVTRLLTGRLFEDARQFEDAPANLRAKLERVVAPMARVEGRPEWDISADVKSAISLSMEAERRGQSIDDLVSQRGLFGEGGYSERAAAIARKFQENPTAVTRAFRQYAKEADLASDEQPMLGVEPPAPEESFRAAFQPSPTVENVGLSQQNPPSLAQAGEPPEVTAAKQRIKRQMKTRAASQRGSFSRRPADEPHMLDDLVTVGAHYIRTVARGFGEWSKAMVRDFGEWVRPKLLMVYQRANQLFERAKLPGSGERGSFSRRPVEQQPTGRPPAKAATGTASAPGQERATASPSYDRTKSKILDRVNIPEEQKAELSRRMEAWEAENPERQTVSFEDIRKEASSLDPMLLLHLKQPKPGETLNPALRFAAREQLNGINEQVLERRKALTEKMGSMDPTRILDEERAIDELEKQGKALLDVLLPTRSQDGRNLAYHAMMAERSFDSEYWIGRARKVAGGTLDPETEQKLNEVLAEGREAERNAQRSTSFSDAIRQIEATPEVAEPEPSRPRVANRNRSRATTGPEFEANRPTPEQRIERGVKRTLQSLEQRARGDQRQPGPKALTPEERRAIAADPRVKEARQNLARLMMRLEKSSVLETIITLRRAGLLSGVKTHLRNVGGNLAFQVLEETSRIPAAIIDAGMSLATGRRTVTGPDPSAIAKASYAAATKGIAEAREIIRTGATAEDLERFDFNRELNSGSKLLDTYANLVFRTMSAEDRVFRRYAYERSIAEQMKLAKTNTPTEAMRTQAVADSEFATFNNRTPMAQGLRAFKAAARAQGPGGKALAFAIDTVIPFQNTPASIVARVLDYSGGGFVKAGVKAVRAAVDGSLTPEQQRYISQNIGRGLTGAALLYMGYKLAESGKMTGMRSDDRGQRERDEAIGRLPGAILVGDTWRQISAFSPVGNLLTIGATLFQEGSRTLKDEARRPGNIAKIATRTVMEQPMLQGVSDIAESLTQPGQRLDRALASTAGSFVPTIVSDIGTLADTKRRDTAAGSTLDSIKNGIMARLPGLRNRLPERTDVLGRPLEQSRTAAVDPTLGSPAREKTDDVARELARQQVGLVKSPRKSNESPEEHRLRLQITGRLLEASLRDVIGSGDYESLPDVEESGDESRRLMLEQAINQARREVNSLVNHEEYKAMSPAEKKAFLEELTQ